MTPTRAKIEFASAAQRAPSDVRSEAQKRLQELATSLSAIPPENPFWESMRISRLCLVVESWSFLYSFEGETLRVDEVRETVR